MPYPLTEWWFLAFIGPAIFFATVWLVLGILGALGDGAARAARRVRGSGAAPRSGRTGRRS